jgi:hypothetical protein
MRASKQAGVWYIIDSMKVHLADDDDDDDDNIRNESMNTVTRTEIIINRLAGIHVGY